jgi:N-acetyl-gamma-glutamyl-phosphate reductase
MGIHVDTISVGIVGHTGYSGAELLRLLRHHPRISPVLLDHREDSGDGPRYRKSPSIRRAALRSESVSNEGLAAVFLATSAEVSQQLAPELLAAGAKVIDLSGAFRLGTPERYQRWYKDTHTQPALLAEAVYGLPEFYRDRIPAARLISNPGCYPTAANLAIRPLVAAAILDRTAGIICDAKSGISGAGRKPSLKTSFCEAGDNFSAYAVLNHRHVPEVLQNSGLEESEFSFTAQLLPVDRGILETIYFRSSKITSLEELLAIYDEQYAAEPFVRVHAAGSFPDLNAVTRTNFCDLGVAFDPATGRGVVVSAIDNLVKGAAGQAIQNMNLALGLPETEGLLAS